MSHPGSESIADRSTVAADDQDLTGSNYSTELSENVEPEPVTWPPQESPSSQESSESSGLQQSSTTRVARKEALAVRDSAVDARKNVAETAKNEAANVAAETKHQAKGLLTSVTSEVKSQAGAQQQKIAASVQSLSKELGAMASGSSESGPLTDLAHQGARRGAEIARWLEDKEPRDVLGQVQSFARRRPVAFLALCGLAGVVAGRLTRGAVAANTSLDSPSAPNSSDRELPQAATSDELPRSVSLAEVGRGAYGSEDFGAVTVADPDRATLVGGPGYAVSDVFDDRSGGVR